MDLSPANNVKAFNLVKVSSALFFPIKYINIPPIAHLTDNTKNSGQPRLCQLSDAAHQQENESSPTACSGVSAEYQVTEVVQALVLYVLLVLFPQLKVLYP